MSDPIKTYQQIRKKVTSLQQELNRAEGALEHQLSELENKYGCSDIKSAKKKLKRLQTEADKSRQAFEDAVHDFEDTWEHVL